MASAAVLADPSPDGEALGSGDGEGEVSVGVGAGSVGDGVGGGSSAGSVVVEGVVGSGEGGMELVGAVGFGRAGVELEDVGGLLAVDEPDGRDGTVSLGPGRGTGSAACSSRLFVVAVTTPFGTKREVSPIAPSPLRSKKPFHDSTVATYSPE